MQMLKAIKSGDFARAEDIRSQFTGLENLRNEYGPIPVLHHAVALSGIADTGSHLPLLSDLDEVVLQAVAEKSKELLDWERG